MAFEAFIDLLSEHTNFADSGESTPLSTGVSPISDEALMPPPGKVDGLDGGFVNDGEKRYWVTSKGHYGYVEGIGRTWIIDSSHFKWR